MKKSTSRNEEKCGEQNGAVHSHTHRANRFDSRSLIFFFHSHCLLQLFICFTVRSGFIVYFQDALPMSNVSSLLESNKTCEMLRLCYRI